MTGRPSLPGAAGGSRMRRRARVLGLYGPRVGRDHRAAIGVRAAYAHPLLCRGFVDGKGFGIPRSRA